MREMWICKMQQRIRPPFVPLQLDEISNLIESPDLYTFQVKYHTLGKRSGRFGRFERLRLGSGEANCTDLVAHYGGPGQKYGGYRAYTL